MIVDLISSQKPPEAHLTIWKLGDDDNPVDAMGINTVQIALSINPQATPDDLEKQLGIKVSKEMHTLFADDAYVVEIGNEDRPATEGDIHDIGLVFRTAIRYRGTHQIITHHALRFEHLTKMSILTGIEQGVGRIFIKI